LRGERRGEPVWRRRAARSAPEAAPRAWCIGRVTPEAELASRPDAGSTLSGRRAVCSPLSHGAAETVDRAVGPLMMAGDFDICATASFTLWRSRDGCTANTTLPPVLQRNGGILCRDMSGG